jgi:hypothetical protein
MTPGTRLALAAAAASLAAACASAPPATWSTVRPPEASVETLPPSAVVSVDGAEVGRGSVSFPVPDESRTYALRATAPGFEPLDVAIPGARLAGTRIDLVLRPEGFGSQRRLVAGEPVGLQQAATALLRAGRAEDALAFAQASLAAGESPQGHKVAGEAWRRLGNREMAVKEWSLYLSLMPDAPDRKAIEQSIAATRRDIEMSPARPGRE